MTELHLTNFDVHRDFRGVMTAILNVAGQPVNVFNESVLHDLDELIRAATEDESVKAIVFRSGKENGFLAGADLHVIETLKTTEESQQMCRAGQDIFRRLEELRIPTIAIINGVCLGGGLEFVLACRHRIVIDDPRTRLGAPEVELGLIPGWGGTQRLPRLVGLSASLPILLMGKKVGAKESVRIGLADALCKTDEVDATVTRLLGLSSDGKSDGANQVAAHGPQSSIAASIIHSLTKPASKSGVWTLFKDKTPIGHQLVMRFARSGIASSAKNYPALPAILTAVSAGLNSKSGLGFEVERDEFAKLVKTDTHKSLLGLFFQRERARKAETWVRRTATKPRRVSKVGILGGGVMGAGIAHWASTQGFEVVLKEVNADLLDAGLCRIRDLFDESVRKETITAGDAATKLSRIVATTDWRTFSDVDLVIEAVTERMDIKQAVFRDLELYCPPQTVLASNTSALSIHSIGSALLDPSRVLGLHFFNPVHRMQLVEIVRTEQSRDDDVAMLIDFVKRMGKTPLVTADSPGFVVNRILFPYLDEAVRLHCEGVPSEEIDKALKQFGMPMGPMELLDQVGIDVAAHVADTLNGLSPEPSPTGARLHEMAAEGHIGRKSGRGFYTYLNGGKKKGHAIATVGNKAHLSPDDIRDRIVLRLVNEAAKCLQEEVVHESWMVDLGLVLGTGFAPFLGGPIRMCELRGFGEAVAKLEYFQKTIGPRFAPSLWLINQIENHAEHHTS